MSFYNSDRPVQERDSWVRDPELEGMVCMISAETAGLFDSNVADGDTPRKIQNGVGSNAAQAFVNDTFAIRDYCWCEGGLHPERVDWDTESDDVYLEMPPSGGTSSGCPLNFEHFASGITCEWYKYLARDVLFNREPKEHEPLAILMDCLRSLPKAGADSLPAVRPELRLAWGWN